MTLVFVLADFLGSVISVFVMNCFFSMLGEKRCKNKKIIILSSLAYCLLNTLVLTFDNFNWYLLIYIVTSIVLVAGYSFFYKMKVWRRVYSSISCVAMIFVSQFLTCVLLSLITSLPINRVLDADYLYVLVILFSGIILYAILKLISTFYVKRKTYVPNVAKICFIILPITSLVIIILFIRYVDDVTGQIFAFVFSLVLIITNIGVYFILNLVARQKDNEKAIETRAKQLEYERQYYSDLYEKQIATDKVTHDLKNKVFALNALLQDNPQKVKIELDEIVNTFNEVNGLKFTGNVAIDALLNNKINLAKSQKIDVNILCYIAGIQNNDIIDLCVVLGNLLDNSIEACCKMHDISRRFINIELKQDLQFLKVTISNGYVPEDIIGYTSKKDKQHHGFGLQNVRDIVDKNDGYFVINQEEGRYTTVVGMQFDGLQ